MTNKNGEISVMKKYQTKKAARLPHVPGTKGKYPILNTVAIQLEMEFIELVKKGTVVLQNGFHRCMIYL